MEKIHENLCKQADYIEARSHVFSLTFTRNGKGLLDAGEYQNLVKLPFFTNSILGGAGPGVSGGGATVGGGPDQRPPDLLEEPTPTGIGEPRRAIPRTAATD